MYGSALLAKDYTLCAGTPIALILCEKEQDLENIMCELRRNESKYVTYHGHCKLYSGFDLITDKPVLTLEDSKKLGTLLDPIPFPQKIVSPLVNFKNPFIDFSS